MKEVLDLVLVDLLLLVSFVVSYHHQQFFVYRMNCLSRMMNMKNRTGNCDRTVNCDMTLWHLRSVNLNLSV